MIESITQLLSRLAGYSKIEILVELALIWVVVYVLVRFLRGTRGAGILKGLTVILILSTVAVRMLGQGGESFQRLNFLYDRTLAFAAIGILVIFQPELRRALIRLGETTLFRASKSEVGPMIEAVVDACRFNSRNRFGALIAIERRVGLQTLVEGGTKLNADVSAALLQSIFWPSSALHDLGVIIRGRKILAAAVQFPLAETGELSYQLGSRHRAAVGITEESDAIAVVVSEETGQINVAERGKLSMNLTIDELRRFLTDRLLKEVENDQWSEEMQEETESAGAEASTAEAPTGAGAEAGAAGAEWRTGAGGT